MIARSLFPAALCACVLLCAHAAFAAVPNPPLCTATPVVVGSSSGVTFPTADPSDNVGFQVNVRDAIGAPIPGSTVMLDFAGVGGTRLYTATPGATVDCISRTVRATTDSGGYVKFGVCVGGFNNANVVQVSADGVIIVSNRPVRSTDIDGVGALTDVNDLNFVRQRLFAGGTAPEADFDLSGIADVADLNLFRLDLFSGVVGSYCP